MTDVVSLVDENGNEQAYEIIYGIQIEDNKYVAIIPYYESEDAILNDEGEVVVLINEYSASASEILVAALKENDKAKVVGKTSYGKGVIQSVLELNDGSVLKLTVSEYFTPKENKINKIGIEPDYDVELDIENDIDTQLNKAIEILK